jgi:hypothetical protein
MWADFDQNKNIQKPNEKAKLVAERVLWENVSRYQNKKNGEMKLCTILPYFIVGPPLYKDVIQTNPSI